MNKISIFLTTITFLVPNISVAYELAQISAQVGPENPDTELAKQHYAAGQAAFIEGRYDAAAVEFKAGYELTHAPEFLFNLSLLRENQERYKEALDYAEEYRLKSIEALKPGESLPKQQEDESRGRIMRLREKLAEQSGKAAQRPNSSGLAETASRKRPPVGALVLFGIGGGSLIVASGCGIGALLANDQANHGGPFFANEYADLVTRGTNLDNAAIVSGVIGASTTTAAIIWTLVHRFR